MKCSDLGQGWHTITSEQHHSLDAIGSSALKMYGLSPYKYYCNYIVQQKPKEVFKPAFKIGTAIHMMLLEPEEAKHHILVCDHGSTTKKFKEFLTDTIPEWAPEHPLNGSGRYVGKDNELYYAFDSDEYGVLQRICENANNHKLFCRLRERATPEVTGIACEHGPDGSTWLSCRGDLRGVHNNIGFFIDIKTIDYLSEFNIQKQLAEFWYVMQMQHYLYVANAIEPGRYKLFYFFFIEKNWPYECALVNVKMTESEQEAMQRFYLTKLGDLLNARRLNDFPTMDKGSLAEVSLPGWFVNKIQSY